MLGARLRKARLARHLTQLDLADRVGVSSAYISMLEHDLKEPSLKLLRAIALVLETTLAFLLAGVGLEGDDSPEDTTACAAALP